ncbi:hypothetical protein [Acididesulfobacillus acetoxydans]|nr:hypothetical protein [Acididesulfobacillus acetoxydans]
MRKKLLKLRRGLVLRKQFHYTRITKRDTLEILNGKERKLMTETTQKLNNIRIPPQVLRELGLEENWQKNVSPEFIEKVIKAAEKYKSTLRRLSKY